ncbi:hypothetical protein LV779_21880 [Streptomyces thinghirensis]|nr:hypothetical protein [Streptomyces thinghirensis]
MGIAQELGTGTAAVSETVFKIGSPGQAEQLHAEAERLLGKGSLDFRVNDKAYRDQVRPIQQVGTFAGLIVWVIAVAGALILGLIVMLQIRRAARRARGTASMGEKKWKLIAQHAVEVAAVALPRRRARCPGGPRSPDRPRVTRSWAATTTNRSRRPGHKMPGSLPPTVRVEPATVGKVAGIGLGISLVSTVIPGIGILRLHPRSILADTD